jgi:hypothetical protein
LFRATKHFLGVLAAKGPVVTGELLGVACYAVRFSVMMGGRPSEAIQLSKTG